MASAGLEVLGLFLSLLGALGTLVCTVLPYWRTSAHVGSNIVTAVASVRGLWMECVFQSTGTFQCETYTSLLALPPDLQASRALMVLSLVLSALAGGVAPLGMRCTLCLGGGTGGGGGQLKARVAGAAGGLFASAGFLALIPVAWTTHEVVQTFHQPGVPAGMRYELGECLYVGLASALLSMLGGALLGMSCCEEAGGARGGAGAGGYPYPGGAGAAHGGIRSTSQTYRNPALLNAASRGPTALVRGASASSQGSARPAHGKRAAGYDVTGYV